MRNFKYLQPENLKESVGALSEKSIPYSGGTDILGLLKNNIISPTELVNLKNIDDLDKIEQISNGIKIGALTKLADIAENDLVRNKFTALAQAAEQVGTPQLRNVGTLGGNIAQRPRCWYYRGDFDCLKKGGDICYAEIGQNKYHAIIGGGPCHIVHPSDTAVALLALNAKLTTLSPKGEKKIPLKDFFILPEIDQTVENILSPDEIITHIEIPFPSSNSKSGYIKSMERGAWDFAVASVAAVIDHNNGKINSGKITFGGVAPIPWHEEELDNSLKGVSLSSESLIQLSKYALKKADPLEHNEYKINLTRGLLVELLSNLVG
ncbi:MAG: xanthine dehydrogenase family protein subunit M [Bacteroidota bacterium]